MKVDHIGGGMHTLNQEELLRCYPKMKDFMLLREQVDSDQIFTNKYTKSLLIQ